LTFLEDLPIQSSPRASKAINMNLNDFGGEKTLKGGSENSIKILIMKKV
jgi:hypothetical protein